MRDAEDNPAAAYQYDDNGNQTQITDPAGNVTKNGYDLDGELTSTTVGFGSRMAGESGFACVR